MKEDEETNRSRTVSLGLNGYARASFEDSSTEEEINDPNFVDTRRAKGSRQLRAQRWGRRCSEKRDRKRRRNECYDRCRDRSMEKLSNRSRDYVRSSTSNGRDHRKSHRRNEQHGQNHRPHIDERFQPPLHPLRFQPYPFLNLRNDQDREKSKQNNV